MLQKRWLLSVGVNDYGAQVALPNLHYAVNDACLIYRTLTVEYNFEGNLLATGRDVAESEHPELEARVSGCGTRAEIIEALNHLRRQMSRDDIFVFFFSGHGIGETPGYFLPYGSEWNRPSSYLMYRSLYGELSALPCRCQALFFDCCYSGIAMQPVYKMNNNVLDGHDAPRVIAFAAAGKHQITPDRIPGVTRDRKYSPFSWTLHEYLTEKINIGADFDPLEYYLFLKKQYVTWTQGSQLQDSVQPQYRDEMPEIYAGRGHFVIQRPGVGIDMQTLYTCRAGEELILNLKSRHHGREKSQLGWEIIPRQRDFVPAVNKMIDYHHWKLKFKYTGMYTFDVYLNDPESEENTSISINIKVNPAVDKPLSIKDGTLSLCIKDKDYDDRIEISGGTPPYNWEIKGIPEPLDYETMDNGHFLMIKGVMPESPEAGTANCRDNRPISFELEVIVTDVAGASVSKTRRLLVISEKDYCKLGGDNEKFIVGYAQTTEKNEAICRMLETYALKLIQARGLQSSKRLEKSAKKVAGDLWNQLKKEVLDVNPGSVISIPAYYIKKYPVTNLEWHEYVKANPGTNHIPSDWDEGFPEDRAGYPVVNITYEAISAYLAWKGTRLPNAWEWERAARGLDGRLFPWGDEFDSCKCNTLSPENEVFGLKRNLKELLKPVGYYDDAYPAEIQVRDIVGNVAEWVDRRVYQETRPTRINGVTHNGYFAQVFRGGSFGDRCSYALVFRDSKEAGLLFSGNEENKLLGNTKTDYHWVGFRDVVDLHAEPPQPQGLVKIPASEIFFRGQNHKIPEFNMSRYAVSNLEYLEFVKFANHQYPHQWKAHNTQPFPWSERHLPVVNIRFRDALAFCLWKSRQDSRIIRLPSAEQWVAACKGAEQQKFPWGDEYDLQKCNCRLSGWGRRLPVFFLPQGRSKEGIYNLVGNVCELVSSAYIRGGGWQDNCESLEKAGFEIRISSKNRADFFRNDVGFRYVENKLLEERNDNGKQN